MILAAIRAITILSSFVAMAPLQEPLNKLAGNRYNESNWHPATEEEC